MTDPSTGLLQRPPLPQHASDTIGACRLYLANQGFLRSTYLGGAVVYVAALTYVQVSLVSCPYCSPAKSPVHSS